MIEKKYIEVQDECLGPDKKSGRWEIYLFVNYIIEFRAKKRGSKIEAVSFRRKSKSIVTLTGATKKELSQKLHEFCNRKDVKLSWEGNESLDAPKGKR